MMVAIMPEWLGMVIGMDELDIAPKDGPKFQPPVLKTSADLVKALTSEKAALEAQVAQLGTHSSEMLAMVESVANSAPHGRLRWKRIV